MLADAHRDKALAEAEGQRALIEAENSLSDSKLSAKIITTIWPELADKLPEIVKALAPQPGILGDTRIYAFPGANSNNGNGTGDINKLLLSTSGLALINTLLEEGKLGALMSQVSQLLRNPEKTSGETLTNDASADGASIEPSTPALIRKSTPTSSATKTKVQRQIPPQESSV